MKQYLFAMLMLVVLNACQNQVKNDGNSKGELTFIEQSHKLGLVKQGDAVMHSFQFSNTGSEALVIQDIVKGCGCTEVNYPSNPILPGETGVVEVVFNSKGWHGKQVKKVTVISNTIEPRQELLLWAEVSN